jgi:hypothetical protein
MSSSDEFEPFEIRSNKFQDILNGISYKIISKELFRDDYKINFNMPDWTEMNNMYYFDEFGK